MNHRRAPDDAPDDDARDPVPAPEAPHAWVLITGDPVGGFCFRGPFATLDDAEDARYGEAVNLRRDAFIAKLYEP
jgi:hypothetical protein